MIFQNIHTRLAVLAAMQRKRTLPAPCPDTLCNLASNDYLGFAPHPALRQAAQEALARGVPAGSGSSRLIAGAHEEHRALETEAARFFNTEKALYFGSGYAAGMALAAALPARGDAIVYDALIHACMRDGIRLSPAKAYKATHNNPDSFADAVRRARNNGARDVWIFAESLYSMDGDKAPLQALLDIARRYEAFLVIDEAHATGIYGPTGRGLTEGLSYEGLITLHTCGKALGCAGGLVCGSALIIDALISLARPFMFSTAPPPLQAAVTRAALTLMEEESFRRTHLLALVETAKTIGLPAQSHIIPIIIGHEEKAFAAHEALKESGFYAPVIRPPTVSRGTERLRISLHVGLTKDDIERLSGVLYTLIPWESEKASPSF